MRRRALDLQREIEDASRARDTVLAHGNVLEYVSAVERLYHAVGKPLGPGLRSQEIWLRFKVVTTAN